MHIKIEHSQSILQKDTRFFRKPLEALCINNVGFIGLKDCGKVLKKPDFYVFFCTDPLFNKVERVRLRMMIHRSENQKFHPVLPATFSSLVILSTTPEKVDTSMIGTAPFCSTAFITFLKSMVPSPTGRCASSFPSLSWMWT